MICINLDLYHSSFAIILVLIALVLISLPLCLIFCTFLHLIYLSTFLSLSTISFLLFWSIRRHPSNFLIFVAISLLSLPSPLPLPRLFLRFPLLLKLDITALVPVERAKKLALHHCE